MVTLDRLKSSRLDLSRFKPVQSTFLRQLNFAADAERILVTEQHHISTKSSKPLPVAFGQTEQ